VTMTHVYKIYLIKSVGSYIYCTKIRLHEKQEVAQIQIKEEGRVT